MDYCLNKLVLFLFLFSFMGIIKNPFNFQMKQFIFCLFLGCLFCALPIGVMSLCSTEHRQYYRLMHHTIGPASVTYQDVATPTDCVLQCDVTVTDGLFQHDEATGHCLCYALPQTLTNVEAEVDAPVWISGQYRGQRSCEYVVHPVFVKVSKSNIIITFYCSW